MAWGDIAPVIKRPKSVLFRLKTASLHETPVSFRFWVEKNRSAFSLRLSRSAVRGNRRLPFEAIAAVSHTAPALLLFPIPLPGFTVRTGFLQESQTIVPLVHREFMRSVPFCI